MYCKKCGKEIKEGNTFCTNCGEPINNIKENTTRTETNTNTDEKENNKSNKKVIKLKLWHIITITLICLALLIGVVVIFNNKNNSDKLQNVNNIVAQDTSKSIDKKYDVEIGKYYKYSLDNQYSTIVFNNSTGFILKSGVVNSEENVETGTYQIEDNKITFTINYNSIYGDGEGISDEDVKIPYTKEMTILENGNIEYVTPYTTNLYVKEGSNVEDKTADTSTNSSDLLETIYDKYPEMKSKEGFICSDGEQYWLLDKAGKKIYFHDLDSFDSALVKSYTSESTSTNNIKIDIEKFVKELSYKSMSTVHDNIHGGDGYRYDYNFYNEDLTLNDFTKTSSNNEVIYRLETNGNDDNNYKFILTVTVNKDNTLKQVEITCTPPTPQAKGILNCAMEVEEALGYTIFNKRNNKIVTQLEDLLKSKKFIEKATSNYDITEGEILLELENPEYYENIAFEYKYSSNTLSYVINFQ